MPSFKQYTLLSLLVSAVASAAVREPPPHAIIEKRNINVVIFVGVTFPVTVGVCTTVSAATVAAALGSVSVGIGQTVQACVSTVANSYATCSTTAACGFSCNNGYTLKSGACVANGPSARARAKRSSGALPNPCSNSSETACPLVAGGILTPGAVLSRSYECIDTRYTLEHCGACFVDCSTMHPGAYTGCFNGQCDVFGCMPGYSMEPVGSSGLCKPTSLRTLSRS